jgi:hypothetical protein
VRWNLITILICISFMAKIVERFFLYLLVICTSFENYLSACLLIELFVLLVFHFLSSLCILDTNPLPDE